MNKKLEESLDTFGKVESGLDTEFFVIDMLKLGEEAKKELRSNYSAKERFKLMKKEYNLSPDTIVKPISMQKIDGKKTYILERIDGEMLISSLYKLRKNKDLLYDLKDQLIYTIEKLHSNGYVHGDLNGGNNIMLSKNGKIKLIDQLYIPKNFSYLDVFTELDNEALNKIINIMYSRI